MNSALRIIVNSVAIVVVLLTSTVSFAQSLSSVNPNNPQDDGEQKLQMAVVLILDGYLYDADKIVDELLVMDPDNLYYNYLKGFNTLYSAKNHELAIKHFLKTIDPEQGKLQLLESGSRVTNDVYYHTAAAYQFLEDIPNAEKYYTTFLELSSKRSELYDVAKLRLKQCAVAKGLLANPTKLQVKLIDGAINTTFPEYSPVISADGNELYYTSRRAWENVDQTGHMYPVDNSYPEDVFFSVKDYDGEWGEPVRLQLCSALNNEASVSLTANMNTLYVYSDRAGNGNLFHSEYEKDDFATMDDIIYKELNTDSWEPHYVSSEDSSLIIFSSDRKGGQGGRDLWSIRKTSEGVWTKPVNLGPNVNTSEDEDAPFVSLDGEYLYYSSNGDKSMGGFDVMRAKLNDLGQPGGGENLGYPINSGGDDVFYSITYDGTDAYFSSFRKGGVGENDIYHLHNAAEPAKVFALSGRVIDLTDDAKEIDLEVELVEKSSNKPVDVVVKRQSYFQLLAPCKEYSFVMKNKIDGEVLYTEDIKTNCDGKPSQLVRNYYNGQYWLEGVLTDADTKNPIKNAKIELVDKNNGATLGTLPSSLAGGFESPRFADLKPGDNMKVSVKISAPGYEAKTFEVDRVLASEGKIHEDFNLAKEVIAVISDPKFIIYFNYDKSDIRNSEIDVMNNVVKLMNDNPTMELKLRSYTDARGTDEYNNRLANRRANASLKYIQKRITNPKRITAQGMGEADPVENCGEDCTDEQHQLNRRTTFEIIRK